MKYYSPIMIAVLTLAFLGTGKTKVIHDQDIADIFIQVRISNVEDVLTLLDYGLQIELNIVRNNLAEGFISENNLEKIKQAGFEVTVIPEDKKIEKGSIITGSGLRKDYYDFAGVRSDLTLWAQNYPSIAKLDTAGYSINGNPIWVFSIAGKPGTEPRQRVYLNSAIHGNEKISTETTMWIAKHLVTNYSTDQRVKAIVDRSEFVIMPILNPDGFTYSNQGRRTLANGRDGNRAFGWKLGGGTSDGSAPYQWPETRTYYREMVTAPYYLSIDYHCGLIALLKPFFAPISGTLLDEQAYNALEPFYPLGGLRTSGTLGQPDVRAGGIGCDCVYGKCGAMAFMAEINYHYPPASQIDSLASYNLGCVLDVVDAMQRGVKGVVYDSLNGALLYARITIKDQGAAVYTDPRSGAFFKYIPSPSGSYEVTAFANGYRSKTKVVQAVTSDFTDADFHIVKDEALNYAALSVDVIGIGNTLSQSEIYRCLEFNDNSGTTIENGFIAVDFGPKSFLSDRAGNDLTVYSTTIDSYTVRVSMVSDDIVDGGVIIGKGQGTQSFDLSTGSIDFARFVRINTISGSPCIDAVEALPGGYDPNFHFITATVTGQGSLAPFGSIAVRDDNDKTFIIIPDPHNRVSGVVVDGSPVDSVNSYTFRNVTAAHTIHVTFEVITHTITASAGANGTIEPLGAVTVNDGTDQTFMITPDSNCAVYEAIVDGSPVDSVTGSYTFRNVTTDHTISVTFKPAALSITASAGNNGTITPAGVIPLAYGSDQTFIIAADEHYKTSAVVVNGELVDSTASYTFRNITVSQTISAVFEPVTFTITASSGAKGSISPAGQVMVNSGQDRAFTVTPDPHFTVSEMTVDGLGVDSTESFTFHTVTADHSIAVIFEPLIHTIVAVTGENGSITPGGQVNVTDGEEKTFIITPDSLFKIFDVEVDAVSVGAVPSYTFPAVTADHTIFATFDYETSTDDIADGNSSPAPCFAVSPNPAEKDNSLLRFYFSGTAACDAEMCIYDALGNQLFRNSYTFAPVRFDGLREFDQWDLKNMQRREISSGTLLAILKIVDNYGKVEIYTVNIGVKGR